MAECGLGAECGREAGAEVCHGIGRDRFARRASMAMVPRDNMRVPGGAIDNQPAREVCGFGREIAAGSDLGSVMQSIGADMIDARHVSAPVRWPA